MTSPVWFITATSSGFGRFIALEALNRGHTVIATARSTSKIQDLKDAGAHILAFDVTSPLGDIEKTAADVFSQYGRVDYLINAAGYLLEGAVEELTPTEVYDCFNTNVFGAINTIKAFLPYMRKSEPGSNGFRGTVVTFGSLGSWEPGPTYSIYAMTKTSASMLAECLRLELSPFDIRSTVIEPGYFRTGFLRPGAEMKSQLRLAEYDDPNTPSGKVRTALPQVNGAQLGDVIKGCKVSVDILTGTGVGEGKDLPERIVLGQDCEEAITKVVGGLQRNIEEWKDVIRSTAHAN